MTETFDYHSVVGRFTMMNIKAAETFELLMRLLDGDLRVVGSMRMPAGFPEMSAASSFHGPLTDAFVFELWRAVRLVSQAPEEISARGINTDAYVKALSALDAIRNVTEHWRDEKKPRKAATHVHHDGAIAVDETSLVIMGASKVLRGGANLYDAYRIAAEVADELRPWPAMRERYKPRT